MDFEEEYKDFFENLDEHGTYAYKFFELFRVYLGSGQDEKGEPVEKGLHWGKDTSDDELTDEQLRALKTYVKTQKTWLRKEKKNASATECRRRMWFFVQKLLEFGAFTRSERREIILWMDNFNFVNGVRIDNCKVENESFPNKLTP